MSHPEFTHHVEFIAMADEGHKDAMGFPFGTWRVARYHDDGRAMRDANGRQVFQTQAEWKARHGTVTRMPTTPARAQLELFT